MEAQPISRGRQSHGKALALLLALLLCTACTGKKGGAQKSAPHEAAHYVSAPEFDADSAYRYVERQTEFGPRVPNSAAHLACGDYLSAQLKELGAQVTEQKMELTAYDGTRLNARNIVGSYRPDVRKRILLCAHWDSRPWADNDPDPANHRKPVLGANDGASGVGVLLEVARQLQQRAPKAGIDIVFFDAEDWGVAEWDESEAQDSWALGSQFWSRTPHVGNYNALYGILLDMVGAPGATFYKEYISQHFAPQVVDKVWETAATLGYGSYFRSEEESPSVMDDHFYVNRLAHIPCIDIIGCTVEGDNTFGDRWHTLRDNMQGIDRNTLKAVGQTLLQVIYNE